MTNVIEFPVRAAPLHRNDWIAIILMDALCTVSAAAPGDVRKVAIQAISDLRDEVMSEIIGEVGS